MMLQGDQVRLFAEDPVGTLDCQSLHPTIVDLHNSQYRSIIGCTHPLNSCGCVAICSNYPHLIQPKEAGTPPLFENLSCVLVDLE